MRQPIVRRSNVELNVPATTDTVYQLASMSKPLLATAALLLTRDARPPFALDDKVGKHLPELPASWGTQRRARTLEE